MGPSHKTEQLILYTSSYFFWLPLKSGVVTQGSEPHQVPRWMNSCKWTLARPLQILWTCLRVCFGSVRGGGPWRCGHLVEWSSHSFPLLLAQCVCFQAGPTLAWDIPCCGPLKPETLEVDVCLHPVCCQTPRQVLQMWPSATRHSGRRPLALSCVPAPDSLALQPLPQPRPRPCCPLAAQGADHPGLVSNPCLHLP